METQETQEATKEIITSPYRIAFNPGNLVTWRSPAENAVNTLEEAIGILTKCHEALDGCQRNNMSEMELEGVRMIVVGAAGRIKEMASTGGALHKHIEAKIKAKSAPKEIPK